MKSVGVLALVLVLVAGIAVNGSRAQPLAATSVAFAQCQASCQPALRVLAQVEAEHIADAYGDVGGPGSNVAAVDGIGESRGASPLGWAFLAFEVARYLLDRLIFQRGSSARPLPTIVAETAFDPVK